MLHKSPITPPCVSGRSGGTTTWWGRAHTSSGSAATVSAAAALAAAASRLSATPQFLFPWLVLWSVRAAAGPARLALHPACPLAMPHFPATGTLCVDATRAGNLAHMLNHSCAPNCYSRTLRCGALIGLLAPPAACAVACSGPAVPRVKPLAQCTFALMRIPSKSTVPYHFPLHCCPAGLWRMGGL